MSITISSSNKLIKNGIPLEEQIESVQEINNSVNWGHYNRTIPKMIYSSDSRNKVLMLAQEGKILGYATVQGLKQSSNPAYISYLAVSADQQKNGFGKMLMEKIFSKALKYGTNKLTLDFRGRFANTGEENKKLIQFYTSFKYPYKLKTENEGLYLNGDQRYSITYLLSPQTEQ